MSFDEVFDLTAGVYFHFLFYICSRLFYMDNMHRASYALHALLTHIVAYSVTNQRPYKQTCTAHVYYGHNGNRKKTYKLYLWYPIYEGKQNNLAYSLVVNMGNITYCKAQACCPGSSCVAASPAVVADVAPLQRRNFAAVEVIV